MFEQQSYDKESRQVESQEVDLFRNYEIKNWEYSPALYKILAISAVLNLAVLAFIGQTNILTLRGCESPFVGRVCQVLDMAYVGALVFGTEREYVDEAYENIELEDAEITFIDVSGETPPLSYPAGYFQIANPVQYAMLQQQALNVTDPNMQIPGFPMGSPSGTESELLKLRPQPPAANPNAFQDDGASSPFKVDENKATARQPKKPRNRPSVPAAKDEKDVDADVTAENKTEKEPAATPTDPVTAVEINRKPMTDFADSVVVKWTANEIDLSQQFTVALNGELTKDGKLDPKKSKWDTKQESGDPRMIEVAKQSVEAMSQSGWLGYLRNLGVDKIQFKLVQSEDKMVAVITSGQKTPERAATVSSGMNGLLAGAKMLAKDPSDERTLLSSANVTTEGSNFILNFEIPKPVVQEIINRRLQEAQAKKQLQAQPNGTAEVKPNGNTAKK